METKISVINSLRKDFINAFRKHHGGKKKIKYVGILSPDDIPTDGLESLEEEIKGTERIIEYHKFMLIDSGIIVLCQWRVI